MNKLKPIILKTFLAVVLTLATISVYSEHKQNKNLQEQPLIKNKHVAIEACVNEALNGGIDKTRAFKTCECFFKTAEKNYPNNKIIDILMAEPNPEGSELEQALSKVINQCMEENPSATISEPIVEPNIWNNP